MTVFDAIRNGESYEVDSCPATLTAHEYREGGDYWDGDKHYYVLRCAECGHESEGWIRDKGGS